MNLKEQLQKPQKKAKVVKECKKKIELIHFVKSVKLFVNLLATFINSAIFKKQLSNLASEKSV